MPTFKCNVNYFIAIFLVGSAFAYGKISASYITPIVILLFVALVWIIRKGNVCPIPVTPKSTELLRIGNLIMTVANSLIPITIIVSVVGSAMVNGFSLASGFIIGGALLLAIPLNIIGIVCVEVARLLNKNKPAVPKL